MVCGRGGGSPETRGRGRGATLEHVVLLVDIKHVFVRVTLVPIAPFVEVVLGIVEAHVGPGGGRGGHGGGGRAAQGGGGPKVGGVGPRVGRGDPRVVVWHRRAGDGPRLHRLVQEASVEHLAVASARHNYSRTHADMLTQYIFLPILPNHTARDYYVHYLFTISQ